MPLYLALRRVPGFQVDPSDSHPEASFISVRQGGMLWPKESRAPK